MSFDIRIGEKCKFEDFYCTVRYIGETQFAPGTWVGIELMTPTGKCDGSVESIPYFSCKPKHGMFVRKSQLQPLNEDITDMTHSNFLTISDSRLRDALHIHTSLLEHLSYQNDLLNDKIQKYKEFINSQAQVNQDSIVNEDEMENLQKDVPKIKEELIRKRSQVESLKFQFSKLQKNLDEKLNIYKEKTEQEMNNQLLSFQKKLEIFHNRRIELEKENEKLRQELGTHYGSLLKENELFKQRNIKLENRIQHLGRSRRKLLCYFDTFEEKQDESQFVTKLTELKKKLKQINNVIELNEGKEKPIQFNESLPPQEQTNRALWVAKIFQKYPQILFIREKLRNIFGKISFSRYIYSETEESPEIFTKEIIDKLIIQHYLHSSRSDIAQLLTEQTGIDVQKESESAESQLIYLLRLGIINIERLWDKRIDEGTRYKQEGDNFIFESIIANDFSIWNEPSDNPENLMIDEELSQKLGDYSRNFLNVVIGANINKLIERLTFENEIDPNYIEAFLMTYRTFTTPVMLLFKLIQRYTIPTNIIESNPKEWLTKKATIQQRVCSVLLLWVRNYFLDFDAKLISQLQSFITNHISRDHPKVAKTIEQEIKRKQTHGINEQEEEQNISDKEATKPIVPKNIFSRDLKLSDINEEEFARQLTLYTFSIFKNIQPIELVTQAWSKPKLHHLAPNVKLATQKFNELCFYIASTVMEPAKPKHRAKEMIRFIKIGAYLLQFRNFNCLMALVAALTLPAVKRLALTKAEVPVNYWKVFETMEKLTSSIDSYKQYKNTIKKTDPPCIPYLGLYLTDITFISDGKPNNINGLIHFAKRKALYNIVLEIQKFQKSTFKFQTVEQICNLFRQPLPAKSPEQLYADSLIKEPRKKSHKVFSSVSQPSELSSKKSHKVFSSVSQPSESSIK
ncbi:guanine nucleotide exchange factor [Anaeramoeba ignava]|uniref:Guanine nucleotide exchange factor n=1 Tax=Anaeramoeba ignava TaxID=1746090 RepID=A0A9Q0LDG2_ANAIG|nr:guanine nucleotide exchange factor [Anaeramoeba ignava]